ncbi:MAG: hypothetical protein WBW16_05865 [Bacteroidota bacterium]
MQKTNIELKENIQKEISKTGFPLEMYVLDLCSKKNTGRMPNVRYMSGDTLREIDLYCFFEEIKLSPKKNETLQHTITSLLIECKKSHDKPWVFFSSSIHQGRDRIPFMKYVSDFDDYFIREKSSYFMSEIYENLKYLSTWDKGIRQCITYFEAFKSQSSPPEIYKAIDSVLSFLSYKRKFFLKIKRKHGCLSCFFFPVVVLDGLLFEAYLDGEQVVVTEQDHIQLRTDYDEEIFIIDIVKKEYFETFFDQVEKVHLEIVKSIDAIRLPKSYRMKLLAEH